jgi:hypothetical protein
MRSCSNCVIELNLKMLILTRPPLEPLSPLCFPSMLPGVEVSSPKTINIKQYLNTKYFSSNLHKQRNFVLQKYFKNDENKILEASYEILF